MRRLTTLFSSEFLEEHAEESHAQLILHELGEFLGYSPPPLIEDAQKIHKQRPMLQETPATQPKCEA